MSAMKKRKFSALMLSIILAAASVGFAAAAEKTATDTISGVQHLLHLKSKSKILQPIEIMGFFMNFFVKFKEIFCCNCCIFISDVI